MTIETYRPAWAEVDCSTDSSPSASSLTSPVAAKKVLCVSVGQVRTELCAAVVASIRTELLEYNYLAGCGKGDLDLVGQESELIEGLGYTAKLMFSKFVPSMTLDQYAQRLVQWFHCSIECLPMALCFIRRVKAVGLPITPRSVHRVLLAAMVVAAKSRDDTYYPMSYYAQCGGVVRTDLLSMEISLLTLLGWDASATAEEYQEALHSLSRPSFAPTWPDAIAAVP